MKRFLIPFIIALLLFSVVFTSCNKAKDKGSSEITNFGEENKPIASQSGSENKSPDATTTTKKGGTAVEYPTYSTQATTSTTQSGGTNTPDETTKGNTTGDPTDPPKTSSSKSKTDDDTSIHWESRIPNLPIPNVQTPSLPQLPDLPDPPRN